MIYFLFKSVCVGKVLAACTCCHQPQPCHDSLCSGKQSMVATLILPFRASPRDICLAAVAVAVARTVRIAATPGHGPPTPRGWLASASAHPGTSRSIRSKASPDRQEPSRRVQWQLLPPPCPCSVLANAMHATASEGRRAAVRAGRQAGVVAAHSAGERDPALAS